MMQKSQIEALTRGIDRLIDRAAKIVARAGKRPPKRARRPRALAKTA